MTLRLMINLIVGSLTLFFLLAVIGLELRAVRESVHEEVVAANRVAAQLLDRTTGRYAAQGSPALLAFLQGMGRVRSNDIYLYDHNGAELYRSPPSPYKTGRDAPRWFGEILAPAPTMHAITFDDCRIEVHANASRAILDAWDDLTQLAAGALGVLLLINAFVFWLVGRAVRPFARIVGAMQSLRQGRFDVQLPALTGHEAAAIGLAFNSMVSELQTHMETERRAMRAESQLSDSRELTRWLERHVEEERRMIARELHDEFGQSVTAIRSMALSIARRNGATETGQAASLIAQEASRLYEAMHGIIPRLTPLVLDNFGLAEALADLVERTCKSQPELVIDTRVDLAQADLGPEVTLTFYRAAQEGVTNALRHGGAQHLALSVVVQDGQVLMRLRDDGQGLARASACAPAELASGGYGLRWLRERVQGLGGTVRLEDSPPRGTQLLVCVPLVPATAPARLHAGLVTP